MVQIISGKKGKGKTKYLLAKANEAVSLTKGTIVYLDKSSQHMYELNNSIRLVNISEYPIHSFDAFIGFVSGLIAQDYDLEQVYFDSFLTLSSLEGQNIEPAISILKDLSDRYKVDFILSISEDAENLSANVKSNIIIAL